jgi:small-conductance mechanosensitive channel
MTIVRRLLLLVLLAVLPLAATAQTAAPAAKPAAAPAAAAPAPALPKVPVPQFPDEQAKLDGWKAALERVEQGLKASRLSSDELDQLRSQTAAVQTAVRGLSGAIKPRLDSANARLAQIKPAGTAAAETDAVRLEQATIQADVAGLQGIAQQAELLGVRSQQDLDAIANRRRAILANFVLRRSQSLLDPTLWAAVGTALPNATARLATLGGDWAATLVHRTGRSLPALALFLVVIGFAAFMLSPGRRWIQRWTERSVMVTEPSTLRKHTAATAIAALHLAAPAIAFFVLYEVMRALDILPNDVARVARAAFVGLSFAFFFYGLTSSMLAPRRPGWRLLRVGDQAAARLVPLAIAIALVTAAGIVLDALNRAITAPAELFVASRGVVAVVSAVLFMAALRLLAPDEDDGAQPTVRSAWRLLIPVGWAVAALTLVAPLAGFPSLGRFAQTQMLVVVTVLLSLVLMMRFADALIVANFSIQARIGKFMRHGVGLRGSTIRQIGVVLSGLAQILLILLAAFTVLATWGIQSQDVLGTVGSAFFGFKVAGLTISVSAILGAVVVFLIGVTATRAVQRWVQRRLLPETSLDAGLQASIQTGVGYAGVVLAAIVALSFAGFGLQNIAIVAGALSVGIGFGLQSIVNNFVSGLILMVERPFKIGDRIEVGSKMGIVRRISVRATVVQTFDNASVIVPNADLISGQVVNWMHGDISARMSIVIGVSYDADPDRMIALLLEIAEADPRVLKNPAPFAIFSNFGTEALEFTLFFTVGNVNSDGGAQNDIRLAILKRLRTEGIEIPHAQRNISLRDLDRIEAMMRGAAPPTEAEGDVPSLESRRPRRADGSRGE